MRHSSNDNEDKNLKDINVSSLITDDALGPFLLVRTMCGRKISQAIENYSSYFHRGISIAAMRKENFTCGIRRIHLARLCVGRPKGNGDRPVDSAWGSILGMRQHKGKKCTHCS